MHGITIQSFRLLHTAFNRWVAPFVPNRWVAPFVPNRWVAPFVVGGPVCAVPVAPFVPETTECSEDF